MPIPINPPQAWFDHPGTIPTDRRITITPEGRVYGYVALWDTCHAGLPGCQKAPKGSPSDYGYAHQGETLTQEGTLVATANIGGGAGHAPLDHGAPPAFYENTSTQLMRVKYGEDEKGLWFSGAMWPDANELSIARIRASAVSGDWRFFGSWRKAGSGYDFAGACLVNMPGYPMANAGDVANRSGEMVGIAASAAGATSPATSFVDAGGNIIALYTQPEGSTTMTASGEGCGNGCGCDKKDITADSHLAPDGTVDPAAVDPAAQEPADAAATDQPKMANETHNDMMSGFVTRLDEVNARLAGLEEMLSQLYAKDLAEEIQA